jgi:hypothetical protein
MAEETIQLELARFFAFQLVDYAYILAHVSMAESRIVATATEGFIIAHLLQGRFELLI